MAKRIKHCDSCTCGLTEISWSDRSGWVDLNDPNDIADRVIYCALDHSYDRTPNGIPHGYTRELNVLLAPIVAKHLSLKTPDWKNETVYMENHEREAFKQDLIAALVTR